MSNGYSRLETLQAYAQREFSNNDNKVQALVNTVHWVVNLAIDTEYDAIRKITNYASDQVIDDLMALMVGTGWLNSTGRSEGPHFVGDADMIGTGGFLPEVADTYNQVQHVVAGLVASYKFGLGDEFLMASEYAQAFARKTDVSQADVEAYRRMGEIGNNLTSKNLDQLVANIIDAIGDKTVVSPTYQGEYYHSVSEFAYLVFADNDEKSPTFTLENFEIDIERFLKDGDDPRVSYVLSHDGENDLSSVKLRWYATKNGEVDDDAVYLGYESAGTLRVGERDSEGEDLEPLMELSGDWIIVTTAEYSGLDEPIVLRTDEVSLSQPLPEMQSVELRNENAVSDDNDLRIDYVLHNPTGEDMSRFEMVFYAGKADTFDPDTAIRLDRESGGTLRDGEEDSEGETIQAAADLEAGDWNLYSVAYWDGHEDGVLLSTNEFTVVDNSSSVDLAIENFRLDDNFLSKGEDLIVRQTSINHGSEDARGTETVYYWSADKYLNVNEDIVVDSDGHGTLRAGEHDTNEYERINYEDLPKGFGYLIAHIDGYHEFDEGLRNELDNYSQAEAFYVA